MLTCFLLLSLAVLSTASPIHHVDNVEHPAITTAGGYAQTDSLCPSIEFLDRDHDRSLRSVNKNVTLHRLGSQTLATTQTLIQQPIRLAPFQNAHQKRELLLHNDAQQTELSTLHSRNPPTANDAKPLLQLAKFKTFSMLMATPLLCQKLEDFYTIIANKIITGVFDDRPPTNTILLELWDFELQITCDKMVVPWSFVQAWVIDMALASSNSFTGFYEALVRGEGTLQGLVFWIHMRVKEQTIGWGPAGGGNK